MRRLKLLLVFFALAQPVSTVSAQTSASVQSGASANQEQLCQAILPLVRSEHSRDGKSVKVRRGEISLLLTLSADGHALSAKYTPGFPLRDDYKFLITVSGKPLTAEFLFSDASVDFKSLASLSADITLIEPAMLSVSTKTARGTAVADYFSISLGEVIGCRELSSIKFVGSGVNSTGVPPIADKAPMPMLKANDSIDFDDFEKCYNQGGAFYAERCLNKSVELTGIVGNYSSDGVLLTLRKTCESERLFNADVKNLRSDFFAANEDKCVRMRVKIGQANFMTPDVLVDSIIWIESDADKSERIAEKERREIEARTRQEEERRQAAQAKREQLELNKNNPEWLYENYFSASQVACRQAVENIAKWDFEWTERWYEEKFTSYLVRTKAPYVVTILGDSIKMQNGFGAWQRVSYACDYNAKLDRASAYLR